MIRFLASLILVCVPMEALAVCTGASPTWSCGPTLTELSNLINSNTPAGFTRNDTIVVTSGSADWGADVLSITKGVTLQGPGRDNLTITGTSVMIRATPDATAITNNETIKIDGFTFDGSNVSHFAMIEYNGAGVSASQAYTRVVLTNNRFRNATGSTIRIVKQARGVIARNLFDRVALIFRPMGNDNRLEWENGNWPIPAFGSSDQLFFEENTFTCSTTYTDSSAGTIQGEQGARFVIRYNTWDLTNCTNSGIEQIDMHGFQSYTGSPSWPNDGQSGSMVSEIYGNSVINSNSIRFYNHRGSRSIVFGNLVTGGSSPPIHAQQRDSGCNTRVNSTWPPPDGEINTTYVFNNQHAGVTSMDMTVYGATTDINNTCPPVEDTDFWNLDTVNCTASACTSGIGRGTTAPTGTCTTGTAYWVASTATPTTDSTVLQSGHLYRCTSTDVWTDYFTPYTYPHPLLQGEQAPVPPPQPPPAATGYYQANERPAASSRPTAGTRRELEISGGPYVLDENHSPAEAIVNENDTLLMEE